MSKGIAFFDFDGTISYKDSFLEFFKFTHSKSALRKCIFWNSPYVVLFYLKLYPNYRLKERFFSYFYKGANAQEIKSLGCEFSQLELPKICYESAWEILNWHKEQQHEIYILTASSDIWLSQWCETHEFVLISTNFEEKNGKFTGKINGKNCYGKEKANRIEKVLATKNDATTYGYGDSKSDRYYLQQMDFHYLMPLSNENVSTLWKPN